MSPRTNRIRKLIEVALPLEIVNRASAREKSIRHGQPSTLHLWWARRPLAACRVMLFAALVDDPDDPNAPSEFVSACCNLPADLKTLQDTPRQRLLHFVARLAEWEPTEGAPVMITARRLIRLATGDDPPPLYDPFVGGGSIPLEGQRLGLEALGADLNPVAALITRALIGIPGWPLAAAVRHYGAWMQARAWSRIGYLYPEHHGETVIAWLWARTVKCPNPACGATIPLVASLELSRKAGRKVWLVPFEDDANNGVRFEVYNGETGAPPEAKVGIGGRFRCLRCGEAVTREHIKRAGMAGQLGAQMIAIVTAGKDGRKGRQYSAPNPAQQMMAAWAEPGWRPLGTLADDPRSLWVRQYGLTTIADLFTPRQLTALTTLVDLVHEARARIHADAVAAGLPDDDMPLHQGGTGARAYAEAVSVYLALAVSRSADYWGSLAVWANQPKNELVTHVFSRQTLPMVWDFAEANPFSASGGSFASSLNYVAKVLEWLPAGPIPGQAARQDAANLPESSGWLIATDPPYYDLVSYADLSAYFYAWLQPALQPVFPDLFAEPSVSSAGELVAIPQRHGGSRTAARQHYESRLQDVFRGLRRMAHPDYPLTCHFAFRTGLAGAVSSEWEATLTRLIAAGFGVVAVWPIRSERTAGLKGAINAAASSVVLTLRPRPDDAPTIMRRQFVEALRLELPAALRALQSAPIAPIDLAQAAVGPGLAIFSRYGQVIESDGTIMPVRSALLHIDQALDAVYTAQESVFDAETRFALAWFEQFAFETGTFDQAEGLARARNTNVP